MVVPSGAGDLCLLVFQGEEPEGAEYLCPWSFQAVSWQLSAQGHHWDVPAALTASLLQRGKCPWH